MQRPSLYRFSGLALALLLLVPAGPATAQLELAAALEAQGSTFGLTVEPPRSNANENLAASEISLSEIRSKAWAMQEGDDAAPAMKPDDKKKRRAGRWLKKHWYVPVLAAVALGVALDSGDDDRNEVEDD